MALIFAEKYPEYVTSMILTGVFLGDNEGTLLGKYGGFKNFYPEYWDQYIGLLPENKRDRPYEAYFEYLMNGSDDEKQKYGRELIFLELLMEMTIPDVERANRICDNLDCYNIAKIESFYTMNDFFIEKGYIKENVDKLRNIPITIVQGRYDLIVPIKSAWQISQLLSHCKLFISELNGHVTIRKIDTKEGGIMIELYSLNQFVTFIQTKTLSETSEKLNLSQPAISRNMKKLEEDIGVKLFDRQKNKIEPNENGKLLYELAVKLLSDSETIVERVRGFDCLNHMISVGCCAPAPIWKSVPKSIVLLHKK